MKFILLWLMLLASALLHAQESCPVPKSLNDVLVCLKERHQLILLKNLEVNESENLSKALGQRPNPVLDVQTVHFKGARQTQIILAQELDFGGKLSSQRAKGSTLHNIKLNELEMSRDQVIEEVLLQIHHLIHLHENLEVNREVLRSLNNVVHSLKRRPSLSPEQEASLINFSLQISEVKNIIALLVDQEEEVLLFFKLNGNYRKEDILSVMVDHYHPLEINRSEERLSLNLERLGLETKLAESELNLQKAVPYDGVTFGPMYMDDKMEVISEKLYGVAFTMPIPVWQVNKAGKEIASITLANTKRHFDLFKHKEDLQKTSLLDRVENLKNNLRELPKSEQLLKSHSKVEWLYSRGLITPTSFLDSHRIWRDVISTKLELEEKILLLSIEYYRLSGKLHEVHL